ncbi:MAG: hypothetical protein IJA86_00225 [Clostridia bacterium]|nr:hypothetical protein [Clostridia bacterium]
MKKIVLCVLSFLLLISAGCTRAETVFREFIVFQDTGSIVRTLAKPQNVLRDGITARVKIVSKEKEEKMYQYPYSVYYIQIVDDYHGGEKFDSETVYSILFVGTPEKQMYRQPPLEIGREYVVLNLMTENPQERTFEASYWFEINTVDGEEFIYPYFLDCSGFDSKIPIENEKENEIYRKKRHDDILQYLKKNRIENPTFDYKFKIEDFLAEFRGIS